MRALLGTCSAVLLLSAQAQQGWMPLSRTVDATYTATMHRWKQDGHSAMRPYLRTDVAQGDSLVTQGRSWFLSRATDPHRTLRGGPLADALVGPSFGDDDPLKYRLGGGGWLEWAPSERWTLHVDAMAWNEALPDYLDSTARATQVTAGEGYAHRSGNTVTHQDWSAWVDHKAGKYFHFTLGRGKHFIGEGYRSLFLSDEATSYPFFKITTTAWRIRYTNLFALMNDVRGAGGVSGRFGKKFTSMHYLSWNITRRINLGVFEAIVWQDNDPRYPRGFDLSYVNPVILYRPVEFGLGSPDNALMGVAFNVKVGRKGLVYSQLMFDEFLLSNIRAGQGWYGNKQGFQLGLWMHDVFRVEGLSLRGELDYVRPFMYTHTDTRQNYSQFGQPLAHPYGSGFWETVAQGTWRKGPWLVTNTFSYALMGADTALTGKGSYGNNIFRSDSDRILRDGVRPEHYGYYIGAPQELVVVQNEFRVGRVLEPRSGLMLELAHTFRSETPENGPSWTTNFLRVGLSAHFRDRHAFQTKRYVLE